MEPKNKQENQKMGSEGKILNEQLMEALQDIKKSLNENIKTTSQLATSVDELKTQHSDFK